MGAHTDTRARVSFAHWRSAMDNSSLTTRQKALALNLDAKTYGTFAEIGGGQPAYLQAFNFELPGLGLLVGILRACLLATKELPHGAPILDEGRERVRATTIV